MQVSVENGTNAGWRVTKQQVKVNWTCRSCGSENRYYWINCPRCGKVR